MARLASGCLPRPRSSTCESLGQGTLVRMAEPHNALHGRSLVFRSWEPCFAHTSRHHVSRPQKGREQMSIAPTCHQLQQKPHVRAPEELPSLPNKNRGAIQNIRGPALKAQGQAHGHCLPRHCASLPAGRAPACEKLQKPLAASTRASASHWATRSLAQKASSRRAGSPACAAVGAAATPRVDWALSGVKVPPWAPTVGCSD